MTYTLEWQPRPVIKTVFHKFVNWCHKLSKFRKKWTLDKGPESQNSTMEITVFQNNFALKLGLRTYSECTKSWVCHVIGVSNRKSQNVKWHENLLKFAFHAYATWQISFGDFLHVISEIYTSRYPHSLCWIRNINNSGRKIQEHWTFCLFSAMGTYKPVLIYLLFICTRPKLLLMSYRDSFEHTNSI